MLPIRRIAIPSASLALILAFSVMLPAAEPARPAQQPDAAAPPPPAPAKPESLLVTVGKSLIVDSPLDIQRIAIANDGLVDAVPINFREVLVNGKAPGETSLIIWQKNGARNVFELTVRPSSVKLDAVRQQIARDFPDADINVTYDNETAFIRGTVKDVSAADRVQNIAATLGKVVNLLRVDVPAEDPQIVLHVRFTDIDRGVSRQLGVNIASGAFNTVSALGTSFPVSTDGTQSFSLSSAVDLLLFRKDINLIAAIQALEGKNLAQTLAEPNVMAINGKPASFLAGGEMPYPQVQPGAGATSVTIAFKEYGIRLNFIPTVTPRGTIRLQVAPEVSALDFGNAITIQGFSVPAITTRRVQTEVELESGQSFVIAGLLDNETTDSWSKVPGIGSIPVLGNLFKTRQMKKSSTELLILITPEIVRPVPADQPIPALSFKEPFMPRNTDLPMGQPGIGKTGPVPVHPPATSVPVEELIQQQRMGQQAPTPTTQTVQIVPVAPAPPSINMGVAPAPMSGSGAGSGGR